MKRLLVFAFLFLTSNVYAWDSIRLQSSDGVAIGASNPLKVSCSNCGGGGSGDITSVGDVTSGAAFDGTSGNTLIFEGSTADTNEISVVGANAGADYTVTIPAKTGTVILDTDIDTSAEIEAIVTDNTGTGVLVFGTDPGISMAGGTLLIPSSTSRPSTCSVGQIYMDTDATSGQRLYACQSANTWALQGDGSTATAGGSGEVLYSNGVGGFASEAVFIYDASTNTLTVDNLVVNAAGSLIDFEGTTVDAFETTLTVVDPTADRTITLPNVTGTVVTTGDTGSVTTTMISKWPSIPFFET